MFKFRKRDDGKTLGQRIGRSIRVAGIAAVAGLKWYQMENDRQIRSKFPPEGEFIQVDGVYLHYRSAGQGRPIVALHGNGGSMFDMQHLAEAAADEFRIILFDRPGAGYSDRPAEPITPEVQARLIHSALVELGVEQPMLLGHSWGAGLALTYASLYPDEVAAVITLAGYHYAMPSGRELLPSIKRLPVVGDLLIELLAAPVGWKQDDLAAVFAPDPLPDDYRERAYAFFWRAANLKNTLEESMIANDTGQTFTVNRYPDLHMPVTILTGSDDAIVPPEQAQRLLADVRHAHHIVLDGAGHMIQRTRVREVLDAIRDMWGRVDA
jgi:pimeloyl-ACP methyl ester carboxylesterase